MVFNLRSNLRQNCRFLGHRL